MLNTNLQSIAVVFITNIVNLLLYFCMRLHFIVLNFGQGAKFANHAIDVDRAFIFFIFYRSI